MSSAAEQHAAQEKIAEALALQMEGQLAEPRSGQVPRQDSHSQGVGAVRRGPGSIGPGQDQQQQQQQRQQLRPMGEGLPAPRSGQGIGPGGAGMAGGGRVVHQQQPQQPSALNTDSDYQSESDEDPNEDPEARKARKKLRRACDYCTQKKVRCDGSRPCRQCTRKNLECKFSICQRSGPRSLQQSSPSTTPVAGSAGQAGAVAAAALASAVAAATAAAAAVGGVGPPPSVQMATALSGGGITSKVDVTYLNFFLKEFNAFVPLTTQDILRDALNPTPSALTERCPDGDEEYRTQNARVAVIQGCISIGAMIKGHTQVVNYLRNVREALTNSFDFVSSETMSAYMVTAYCHDLMGNAAATRNYMEFAKAVATQLPQVTVDHELVFQFYRVCSEVHNCTLSATPKLLQHHGAAAPCYQVLNVLTYALYDLAHLAAEELTNTISKAQVMAELNSLLPILTRADGMSRDNSSSFGALGVMLVKGVLGYILLRLGRSQDGLEVLEPVVGLLSENPGLLRQVMCWHLSHCILVIFLEHGWFKEYEIMRGLYNRLLQPGKGGQHFTVWGRGHFQDATPFPPVDRLHSHGNSFLCSNPICKAINRDLSEGVDTSASVQDRYGAGPSGPQPMINMVTGEGFLNFDSEAGVNFSNSVPSPTSPRSSTSTTRSGSNAGGSQYSLPGFGASANSSGAAKSNSNSSGATVSASATGTALNQMLPVHAPSSAAALPSSSSPPPTSASSPPFFMTGAAVDVTTPTPLSESTAPLPSHQRAAVPTRGAMTADEGKKRALTDRTVREGQCVSVPGVGIGGGQQQHDAGWSCAGSARDRGGVSPGMSQPNVSGSPAGGPNTSVPRTIG